MNKCNCSEEKLYYCQNCSIILCVNCAVNDHRGHNTIANDELPLIFNLEVIGSNNSNNNNHINESIDSNTSSSISNISTALNNDFDEMKENENKIRLKMLERKRIEAEFALLHEFLILEERKLTLPIDNKIDNSMSIIKSKHETIKLYNNIIQSVNIKESENDHNNGNQNGYGDDSEDDSLRTGNYTDEKLLETIRNSNTLADFVDANKRTFFAPDLYNNNQSKERKLEKVSKFLDRIKLERSNSSFNINTSTDNLNNFSSNSDNDSNSGVIQKTFIDDSPLTSATSLNDLSISSPPLTTTKSILEINVRRIKDGNKSYIVSLCDNQLLKMDLSNPNIKISNLASSVFSVLAIGCLDKQIHLISCTDIKQPKISCVDSYSLTGHINKKSIGLPVNKSQLSGCQILSICQVNNYLCILCTGQSKHAIYKLSISSSSTHQLEYLIDFNDPNTRATFKNNQYQPIYLESVKDDNTILIACYNVKKSMIRIFKLSLDNNSIITKLKFKYSQRDRERDTKFSLCIYQQTMYIYNENEFISIKMGESNDKNRENQLKFNSEITPLLQMIPDSECIYIPDNEKKTLFTYFVHENMWTSTKYPELPKPSPFSKLTKTNILIRSALVNVNDDQAINLN